MPKLPDATALSNVAPRAAKSFTNIPVVDYAGLGASMGQAVSNVGTGLANVQEAYQKKRQAQERFDTRLKLLDGEQAYQNRVKDLDPLDPDYVEKVKAARKDTILPIVQGVRDPENQQFFAVQTKEDYIKLGQDAQTVQRDAFGKKAIIDVGTLVDAQNRAIADGKDPELVLNDTLQTIEDNQQLDKVTKLDLQNKARVMLAGTAVETKAINARAGAGGAADKTAAIIRQAEGYRGTPYFDVNHFRVGYGSDTVTLADGSVVPVKKGMLVNREDAERDLRRRANETLSQAAKDVGPAWEKLTADQQAALGSVAYNYGSLPKRVVAAIKTGDSDAIANAVESLGDHNGGINQKRRSAEAAIIRGENVGIRPSAADTLETIKNDPMYKLLPVDKQQAVLIGLSSTFKDFDAQDKAELEARKVDLKGRIANDIATVADGGAPAKDLSYDDIATTLGVDDAENWRLKAADAAEQARVTSDFRSLTNDQIDARVSDYTAIVEQSKGGPDYARRLGILEDVKKKQDAEISFRKTHPNDAALRYDFVQKAAQDYTDAVGRPPRDPYEDRNAIVTGAFGNYLQATTEAQVSFGIPRQGVAIVDDGTASKISSYFLDLPADLTTKQDNTVARDTLSRVYSQLRNTFGDYTDEVIAYSLAKSKPVSKETSVTMVSLLSALAKGKDIRRASVDTVQRLQDADQADAGLMGFFDWFSTEDKPNPEDAMGVR